MTYVAVGILCGIALLLLLALVRVIRARRRSVHLPDRGAQPSQVPAPTWGKYPLS